MRYESESVPAILSNAEASPSREFLVPSDGRALLIRNGIPEQYCPPGHHVLPASRGKVEVRLLAAEIARQPILASPGYGALDLPFERSFLFVDGAMVGVLKPAPRPREGELKAWEDYHPPRASPRLAVEPLRTCLTERLRTCLPSAGVCCGGRVAASTTAP